MKEGFEKKSPFVPMPMERRAEGTESTGEICLLEGRGHVLLVAPHAFKGDGERGLGMDEENTGLLARELAKRYGFYAVINERYKRVESLEEVRPEACLVNCNRIDQVCAHACGDFLKAILLFKNKIVSNGSGFALVVHLHGIHDRNVERYARECHEDPMPSILIGYGQSWNGGGNGHGNRLTAPERLVDRFIEALTNDAGPLYRAVKTNPRYGNYCGWNQNNLNQIFRNVPYLDPRVRSLQLEIKRSHRRGNQIQETIEAIGRALCAISRAL